MILTAVCFEPNTAGNAVRPMQEKPHRADIQVRHPAAETLGPDAFVAVGVDLLSSYPKGFVELTQDTSGRDLILASLRFEAVRAHPRTAV